MEHPGADASGRHEGRRSGLRTAFRHFSWLLPLGALVGCDEDPVAPEDLGSEAVEPIDVCEVPPLALPPSVDLLEDVRYRTVGGRALGLDIAWPRSVDRPPLVILIHGGGWQEGSKRDLAGAVLQLAGLGYVAASVEYRLAPQFPFPAAINDLQCAVSWLATAAEDGRLPFSLDPTRMAVMGVSAGGHLASLLAVAGGHSFKGGCPLDSRFHADAAVALSAPQDLTRIDDFPLITGAVIERFLGGASAAKSKAEEASPVSHVDGSAPPFLLVHGREDDVVPLVQAERMHEKIRAEGGASTLLVLEMAGHDIVPVTPSPSAALASCTTLRFLDESLRASSGS